MIDISPFTEDQWYRLCDANTCLPVPLKDADLTKPFVYDRKWGVFYVPQGYHNIIMATLLAFHHDELNYFAVGTKLGINMSLSNAADLWLKNTIGVAFKSSVRDYIYIGAFKNLSVFERRVFHRAIEIF